MTMQDLDLWEETYPAVDVMQQLRQMHSWLDANQAKRKTSRGMKAFINRWLGKEQDKGRASAPQSNTAVDVQDEVTVIQREVALLESSINSENQRMLYLIDAKRPQHEVDPSKRKIAELSNKRRELLERVANLEAV